MLLIVSKRDSPELIRLRLLTIFIYEVIKPKGNTIYPKRIIKTEPS